MSDNTIQTKVTERIVVKKFEGDGPNDRTDEPLETVVIEDGKIIEIIKRGN